MAKYHPVNCTDDQFYALEIIQELLEMRKEGPYGGYGGSVSKGDALKFACEAIENKLRETVLKEAAIKRAKAASNRKNNNPGLIPGISRKT